LPSFSGAASRSPTNGNRISLRRQIRPSEPLRYNRAHQIGAIESGNEDSEPLNFGYERNRSYRASAISGTENAVSTQLMGAQAVQRHVGLLLFVTFSFKQRKSEYPHFLLYPEESYGIIDVTKEKKDEERPWQAKQNKRSTAN
jgi:hypothetical protein